MTPVSSAPPVPPVTAVPLSLQRLVVVSAGLSQPSSTRLLADRLTAAVVRQLANAGGQVQVQVVELLDHAHDITTQMLRGFAGDALDEALRALSAADGAIAVTPIYTASYSGLFKSFLDILEPTALTGLPVLLAATGGTERHSLALEYAMRPVFHYLHATTMPTAVYAATGDWGGSDSGASTGLTGRIDRAAAELAREMLRSDRDRVARAPDPLALPIGFDPVGVGTAAGRSGLASR